MPMAIRVTVVLLCAWAASVVQARERPNIVLVMADDIGVEGLGCYGGTSYKTPALDRLAREGMRFTHAYSQPLCTNTRVQLMTGLYNNRNWRAFGILDAAAKTIGHYMQEAGYRTCIAGKWQLQSYDPPSYPGSHLRRGKGMKVADAGFHEYSLFHSWHTEDKGSRYANPTMDQNGKLLCELKGEYGPDRWVEFVNDFISREKDSEQPFFVYYAMALPHRPFVPTPDVGSWQNKSELGKEDIRHFPAMVEYMDRCVGRVVNHLDRLGLSEETLVIFYSDNGTHRLVTSQTTSGPVTGGKGRTTNAGTHVPLIARWPGKIRPQTNKNLVDSTDFLPTLREAAGKPIPGSRKLDGISFYGQLVGEPGPLRPWVFCHYDPRPGWDKDQFRKVRFARDKRYKLYGDGKLYDVASDKLEKRPILRDADTDVTRKARELLASVLETMPNPDPAPRDGDPGKSEQRLYLAAGDRLTVFGVDAKNGNLLRVQELPLAGAGPFTFAPNRKLMYVVAGAKNAESQIATLEINKGGKLKLVNTAPIKDRAGYLMTDNNGEFLAGNHYGPGKATVWKIDPVYRGETVASLVLEPKAHSAVFSPDNRWLLVPATGPNKVFINQFTAQVGTTKPGKLAFAKGPEAPHDARQPRHLIFHPNLSVVYTTNERERPGVGVWRWDSETGGLRPEQNIVTQPAGFDGMITTADLHLTPDGRFLYVSNRDITERRAPKGRDSIVAFSVEAGTGRLKLLGHTPCERVPRSFAVDKLGKFVYVAGQGDAHLGAYEILESGLLKKLRQYQVGDGPIWVEALSLP